MQENPDVVFVPTAQKRAAIGIAQKLLKEAGIFDAPVSLIIVIEHLQKSQDLIVQKISNVSDKVSGLIVKCKKQDEEYAVIGYNENHPWCRRRFTIGHEIGHLLMGHLCDEKDGSASLNEREANVFASELLVPTACIKKDFKIKPDLAILAKKYLVSKEAMTYKIMDLRLL
jgi:Zn-dependent peptidase ImmA (M78 family)